MLQFGYSACKIVGACDKVKVETKERGTVWFMVATPTTVSTELKSARRSQQAVDACSALPTVARTTATAVIGTASSSGMKKT